MKQVFLVLSLLLITLLTGVVNEENNQPLKADDEVELKELVVQASRMQTRLKELPAAVTVLATQALETQEVHALSDITALVPNFFMPVYGSQLTSPVYIRGIGSRINSPSVGLYVDQVPYFEKASFDFDFMDVQKVEVLRGPQGTLFGRNSMGGLINVTTRSPFDYQGTHVRLSAASYGEYRAQAGHYQMLSDQLAYSLSVNYLHRDGFHTNTTLGEQADALDNLGLRAKLQYRFAEQWSLDYSINTDQSSQGGYPYALYDKTAQTIGAINYNQASGYDRFLMSQALKLGYTTTDWEFSNVLSYQLLDDNQQLDQDFGPDSIYMAGQLQKQHNLANELMFRSKGNSSYQWLTGLFGFMQNAANTVDVESYKTPTPGGPMYMTYQMNFMPTTMGAAIFHQSTYAILPELTVTAGLRLDYEQSQLHYTYEGQMGANMLAPKDTVYPGLKDWVLLPKLAVNWSVTPGLNVYASYSSGYKPGGFNNTFERPEHLMFRKEQSNNFELGAKADLFNYLYTELALFYSKLENQQIYRTAPSGRGSYLDNSGLSRNSGLEFSLHNRSFHGFEGMLSYGYTHAEILEYELSETVNYNNKYTPYIPRHTMALQGTQTILCERISFLDKIKLNLLYQQNGTLYWDLANNLKEEAYGLLNAKVSFVRKNMQIELWAKNIANTQYNAFIFEVGPAAYAQSGRPRQIGLNLSVKF